MACLGCKIFRVRKDSGATTNPVIEYTDCLTGDRYQITISSTNRRSFNSRDLPIVISGNAGDLVWDNTYRYDNKTTPSADQDGCPVDYSTLITYEYTSSGLNPPGFEFLHYISSSYQITRLFSGVSGPGTVFTFTAFSGSLSSPNIGSDRLRIVTSSATTGSAPTSSFSTSIDIGNFIVDSGSTICVPIKTAGGFNNVLVFEGTIEYDNNILTFYNTGSGLLTGSFLEVTQSSPGIIDYNYIQPTGSGITASSGSTLFELCFTGSAVGTSSLEFTNTSTQLNIQTTESYIQILSSYSDGQLIVSGFVLPGACNTTLFEFSGSNITYNHGLGTKAIVTNIYDSGGYQIAPNSLTSSLNKVDFDFTFPTEGWIVVQPAQYSQSFSASTSVNVSHSLNTQNIIVNTFDSNDTLIVPDLVTISGSNNIIVDFAFTSSGYISVIEGIVSQSFTSVTQSLFAHGLQTKNVLLAVYDTNNEQIVPDNIQLLNDNTASITFTTPTSGKVVIDRVCRTDNAIFIGTASISQSDAVCLPITVGNDFNNILTWQGTINFDPNVVTFATASNNNIGLTLFNPIPGNLTFSWISPYLTGSNFTSGSTLLELCFSGSNSGSTSVQFTGSPTLLEMSDTNSVIIDVNYFSGSIEVAALPLPPSTSVYIGSASVSQSDGVCVPITVGDGFENVLTWQGTIAYNEFVLDYVNTTNNNLGITLFNPTSGSLTFSWISPYITGSTFSSGSTLFEVCFTASEGGFSELEFTSSPTLLEMSDNSGSIFVVDYYTGSIFVTPLTSSNIDVTLYLYATSSEAEFFDILYSSGSDGPWIIAPSGSSVDLLNRYSYTVSIPTGSNYLKLVNKNPEYFPDNFRIHDITFGEPPKGTIPTGSPVVPNLIQSMSGEITIYNDGPSSIEVTNLYMSASIYQQNAFMPVSVTIGSGSSSVFIVDSLPTTGSPITFPDQIELVVEISGSVVSQLTGSWVDGGSNTNIYPNAYWSGSLFSSPYTYTYTYFDTKPTFTSQSQARIIGTLTL
jgi:hypothetical protein